MRGNGYTSYNVERPHFGEGMNRKPPFEKLREFHLTLPEQFALLPPIILDDVSTFWAVGSGNDLLTPYIFGTLPAIGALRSSLIFSSQGTPQGL